MSQHYPRSFGHALRRLGDAAFAPFVSLASRQYAAPWRVERHDVTHKW